MSDELNISILEDDEISFNLEGEQSILVQIVETAGPSGGIDLNEYMKKSIYDKDKDNIVDETEKVDGGEF